MKSKLIPIHPNPSLTEEEMEFCAQYVSCNYNAAEAVRQTFGNRFAEPRKKGYALLQKEEIRVQINELKALVRTELDVDVYYITRHLKEIVEDKTTQVQARLMALSKLSELTKEFTPKSVVEHTGEPKTWKVEIVNGEASQITE